MSSNQYRTVLHGWSCARGRGLQRVVRSVAEEEVAGVARTGLGFTEIGSVAVDPEVHVTCSIPNGGVRMGGSVVEQLDDLVHSGFGCCGLFRRQRVESEEHGVIDGTRVEKEGTDDFLDAGASRWWKDRGSVRRRSELSLGAVDGGCPRVGRILGPLGRWVFKALEGLFDVARHGEIASTSGVVPSEMNAGEDVGVPVDSEIVLFAQAGGKEFDVVFLGVADKEIVNNKGKKEIAGAMTEKSWCTTTLVEVMGCQVLDERLISNVPCLFETVHAAVDAHIEISIGCDQIVKVVMIEDGFGDKAGVNSHVLRFCQAMTQVEIGDVQCACFSRRMGEHGIDGDLESSEITGASGSVTMIGQAIPTNREADAVGVSLLGPKAADNA